MNAQLLIPAAGMGRRLGFEKPKALVPLKGKPLILITLERLSGLSCVGPALVVVPPGHQAEFERVLAPLHGAFRLVCGGDERRDSVAAGLAALEEDADIAIIHDAARPFVPLEPIRTAVEAAERDGAATLAVPVSDTILVEDGQGFLEDTPDRTRVWACQTPQVFRTNIIRSAYDMDRENQVPCTDDATLVRRAGFPVRLVTGDVLNFKITTPWDLMFAEYLLEQEKI